MTIEIGKPAPDFTLQDQDDRERTLTDFRGEYLLLYFYPKDMTPGCTVEAKGFRDSINNLVDAGLQVVGVSADTCQSHKRFAQAHQLNFPLLADTDHVVCAAYGVMKEKSLFGKTYISISRESFLIDPHGIVVKHYEKVNPKNHPTEVLRDVQQFTGV